MKIQVNYQDKPLKNLQLQGLHLIEASAGTGKTWTLSSLMVRILAEKYMPRQVIATTFTRAAAAELKSRIRKRFTEIYHAVQIWQQQSVANLPILSTQLNDPLQQILFEKFSPPYYEDHFDYLINRLKLVIDTLDELFVGTIDSFTQKLLREFSFESGEIIPRQLTENEKQYPYQIAHDVLRGWLQAQSQDVVDLLLYSHSLHHIDDYIVTIQKTLNFTEVKLQQVEQPQLNITGLLHAVEDFKQFDLQTVQQLQDYFLVDGAFIKQWDGRTWKKGALHTVFSELLPYVQQGLSTIGILLLFHKKFQNSHAIIGKKTKTILEILQDIWTAKGVKNPESAAMQTFYQHPCLIVLSRLVDSVYQLQQQLTQIDQYLHYYLAIEVRNRLPQVLLQAGETTFNQQTQTLGQALLGDKGKYMAHAIQQRYPVILVDEFQDTNQQQDNMLQAIWRDQQHVSEGCFIAVGDPKQAIYGFRGGDILTYLNAFNDIARKSGHFYRLNENFRSTPALVRAVDGLFQRQIQFGEQIEYYQANSGLAKTTVLIESGKEDHTPLRWVQLDETQNENEVFLIAQKIRDLLALSQQQQLYLQDENQQQSIQPEHIAVLAASHYELDQLQQQLENLHIPVNRSSLVSVFSSTAAQDVAALLNSILYPEQEASLKRALLTPAIGLTLQDFCQFEQDAEQFNQHMQHFRQARQLWLQKGFLIAWQWLADHYQIWQNLAKNSGIEAERAIVNTRHLIELLSQQSRHFSGLQHLMHWYQLQLGSPAQREWELERKLSSESGVQLMTIHKSKGLEFKIVFLMHANKAIDENKNNLIFFEENNASQTASTRVIAINAETIADNQAALKLNLEKIMGENHRLWYVALTRASYRIYAFLRYQAKPAQIEGGVAFWLSANDQNYQHPAVIFEQAESLSLHYQATSPILPKLYAVPYPSKKFYPKSRTSFSYLAAHLRQQQALDALAEFYPDAIGAEDEINVQQHQLINITTTQKLAWIRYHFPRGTIAGNCLHEIFEGIDFQNPQYWEKEIQRKLSHYALWSLLLEEFFRDYPEYQQQEIEAKKIVVSWILQWLQEIIATPILPEHNFSLQNLSQVHKQSEFAFYISLADRNLNTQALHQIFLDHSIMMPAFETAYTARFLNGAIDLVFFDGQRYHIADYKSNLLGEALENYQQYEIEKSMSVASYWLQASIYLVVLHRYLQKHLANYDPHQHLGGACYLYLRGMVGKQGYGVKYWQADISLILQLNTFFGQHE